MTDDTTDQSALEARVQELEDLLHLDYEKYLRPFNLTQQQGKLLALLMDAPVASAETIKLRIKMDTEAKVAVHRLRARLEPHSINVQAKRFHGFWLEPEDKAKVAAIIE